MLQGLVGQHQTANDLAYQALHSCDLAVCLQAKALWALLWAFEQLNRAEGPQAVPARAPVGKAHAGAAARFTSSGSGQFRPALVIADTNAGSPVTDSMGCPKRCLQWLGWPFPVRMFLKPCSLQTSCDAERAIALLAGMAKGCRGDVDATDTTLGQQDWQIPAVHVEGAENSQGLETHAAAAGGQYQVILCICPTQIQFRETFCVVSAIRSPNWLLASHALEPFPGVTLPLPCS